MVARDSPLVSILIPVFNSETYLPALISSLQAQTYPNFEAIFVDDKSNDTSLSILEKAAGNDHRIRVSQNEKNLGPSKTLNRAANLANGKLLARLDSDDTMTADRLSVQVKFFLANPSVGLLGSDYNKITPNGKRKGGVYAVSSDANFIRAQFVFQNVMGHSTTMYRRGLFEKIGGYNEKLRASLDYDFLARLSQITDCGMIKKTLINYRVHQNNISSTKRQ